ncbi:MAG: glycosyltransferase [Clostridia bacterium]
MDNKQMKISILEAIDCYLPDVDGVINCVHNYCLNLCKTHDLTVAVPKNRKDYVDIFPYVIKRCKSIRIPIINSFYGLAKFDRKFKKETMSKKYDIVHVHSPFGMAKFALKIAKKQNIPAVATFHSNMRPIFKDVLKINCLAEFFVRRLGKLYNKFDEIFVCSDQVAMQARSYGYNGKISILPYGTELQKCDDVEGLREKANIKFNLKEKDLVLIYVGRIMKLKRIDFILKSLKLVKSRGFAIKFFIVGKGSETNQLKKLCKTLGFSENEVIFAGFIKREEVPQYFARSDLLLFPSIYDNFGLVKVEAASYSTPGLFIENSCAGAGVIDGVNGFLSKDSIEAFADKICDSLRNPCNLKQVGKNATRDLYINWKDCTTQLEERLKEIVKKGGTHGNKK